MTDRRLAPGPGPVGRAADGGSPGPAPTPDAGDRLAGRYRLGAVIGRGGMAEVVEAFDNSLGRAVAVKRLRPEYAHDADVRRRFTREARAGARIHHPNVVAIYDVGEHAGVPFLVMERLPGITLHDEIGAGPRSGLALRELAVDMLGAIGAAHGLGILHRDIKPANVLLDEHGRPKVGDFGIAVVQDDVHHTSTGLVLGTLSYLAPERLAGAPATPAADLYAAGVVLFEVATGRPAFRADSPLALARAVADDEPVFTAEDRTRLDPRFVAAVRRAMAKDPVDRFESAEGMVAAITAGGPAPEEAPATLPVRTAPAPTRRLEHAVPAATPRTVPEVGTPRPRRARRVRAAALGAVLLLAGAAGVIAVASQSGSSNPPAPGVPPSSAPVRTGSGPLDRALDGIDRSIGR